MGFGDFVSDVGQVITVGTSAVTSIQKATGNQPIQYQTCSYPDGSRVQWPLGSSCPSTNPLNPSQLTQSEILGVGALLVGGIVLLVLVLK